MLRAVGTESNYSDPDLRRRDHQETSGVGPERLADDRRSSELAGVATERLWASTALLRLLTLYIKRAGLLLVLERVSHGFDIQPFAMLPISVFGLDTL